MQAPQFKKYEAKIREVIHADLNFYGPLEDDEDIETTADRMVKLIAYTFTKLKSLTHGTYFEIDRPDYHCGKKYMYEDKVDALEHVSTQTAEDIRSLDKVEKAITMLLFYAIKEVRIIMLTSSSIDISEELIADDVIKSYSTYPIDDIVETDDVIIFVDQWMLPRIYLRAHSNCNPKYIYHLFTPINELIHMDCMPELYLE